MKHRLIIVLFGALCLSGCGTTPSPPPEPICPEPIDPDSIDAVVECATTTLKTVEEKRQLLNDIVSLYEWRRQLTPLNYESREEFEQNFLENFRIVELAVLSRIEVDLQFDAHLAAEMHRAYRRNRLNFHRFGTAIMIEDDRFREYGVSGIAVIQARFVALAFAIDETLMRKIARFTGFFPFC